MIYIYSMKYALLDNEKKYQKEHRIGRFLLKKALKDLYGIELELEDLENFIVKNEHGKPSFKSIFRKKLDKKLNMSSSIFFNISHSSNIVICALYDKEIGVDIEKVNTFKSFIIKKILTDKEREYIEKYKDVEEKYREIFFRFWTLKESYLKYKGSGFFKNPLDIEFIISDDNISSKDENVSIFQDIFLEDYIFSLCFEKVENPTKEKIIYMNLEEKFDFEI